jgi:glycosyltransferase involved in cell wall biosynthesis
MGSDVNSNKIEKIFIKSFNLFFWDSVIVKSEDMKIKIGIDQAEIIPNGIDFSIFKPMDQSEAKDKVGFDKNKNQVLWLADPKRHVKNIELAKNAFSTADVLDSELKIINGIQHHDIPTYMNACDVLLLTSRWEGSPNVIKEAMACNTPIVTTRVGDVELTIGDTEGCFIVEQNEEEMAEAIKNCLKFNKRTKGREKIKWLDSNVIANKLIKIYKEQVSNGK